MRALDRREPDRIPHFEWLFAKNVREAICPGCTSHNDFAVKMGHDAVLVGPDFQKEQVGPTQWRSEWGYVNDYGNQEHGVEVECPIQSMSDFELIPRRTLSHRAGTILSSGRLENSKAIRQ